MTTIAAAAFAACKFTPGAAPGGGDAKPLDTVDAVPDGPSVCPSVFQACSGDTLITCPAIGSASTSMACGWGCLASGSTARCKAVTPSGGAVLAANVVPGFGSGTGLGSDVILTGNLIMNGGNGAIGTSGSLMSVRSSGAGTMNGIDYQAPSTFAVFRFKSLMVTGTLTLTGNRPIALVVDGPISVANLIDARGFCGGTTAGPGGSSGGNKGQNAPNPGGGQGGGGNNRGGGGGGYGGSGADGAGGNLGGSVFGDNVITALAGGGGGGGGDGGGMSGLGGGGGGGLQLVSNTSIDVSSGGINAGGCGGEDGSGGMDGGGGGGGGGAILLEAPKITIAGALAVNGGGGGGGASGNMTPGTSGLLSRAGAAGGTGGANGGSGAAGALAPTNGRTTGGNGGGGGGGIGWIRFNTRNGTAPSVDNTLLSPALDDVPTTCTAGAATVQ